MIASVRISPWTPLGCGGGREHLGTVKNDLDIFSNRGRGIFPAFPRSLGVRGEMRTEAIENLPRERFLIADMSHVPLACFLLTFLHEQKRLSPPDRRNKEKAAKVKNRGQGSEAIYRENTQYN